eukprot:c23399_g2_i1 orf=461-2116(-)
MTALAFSCNSVDAHQTVSSSLPVPTPAHIRFASLPELSSHRCMKHGSPFRCLDMSSLLQSPSPSFVSFSSISWMISFLCNPDKNPFPVLGSLFPLAFLAPAGAGESQRINSSRDQRSSLRDGFFQAALLRASLSTDFDIAQPVNSRKVDRTHEFNLCLRRTFSTILRWQENDDERGAQPMDIPLAPEEEATGISQIEMRLGSQEGSFQGRLVGPEHFRRTEQIDAQEENSGFRKNSQATIMASKHLLAGVIAAIVSRTFVAPLERLKLEYMVRGAKSHVLEVIQFIVATEGLGGFWRGNIVNLLRTAPFKSLNFFCYDAYRKRLLEMTGREEVTNFERLVAGAAAGITATLLCFPMDTIRTRMVAPGGEALGGISGCFWHMLHTEGFLSLYKGLVPAVIAMAPSGAVFYGVYDILKSSYLQSPEGLADLNSRLEIARQRRHKSSKFEGDLKEEDECLGQLELGTVRTLLYGAIAGICSETATYPFEVVRRQLQMQNAATKTSALVTCGELLQKGGLGALYVGLLPSALQVLPSAAISYFVYEYMKVIMRVA